MARSLQVQVSTPQRADTPLSPLYKRYRFIALATYGALLLAGLADGLSGGVGPNSLLAAPEGLRFVVFLAALLGLIGLELLAVGSASFRASERVGLPQLVFRLLLFSAVLAFGDPLYSQVIFLVLILYLYLAVRKWVSYAVAALGCLILLGLGVTANPIVPTLRPPPAAGQPSPGQSPAPLTIGRLIDHGFGLVTILFFDFLLARAMARAAQDQEELEVLHASLETSHRQLQASTHQVAELAATEERNRLARDIHDSLGHHLSAINIQLEKASAYRARDPERASEAVEHAKRTVKEALKDVRTSVSSLREEGEAFSLDESLKKLVERMNHSNVKIELQQDGTEAGYSKLALMTLYRAVQEGLTNIHKHAGAEKVYIHLHLGEDEATLRVEDTGRGFDGAAWEADFEAGGKTYGLQGLKERLNLVGGHLELTSRTGQGTKLDVIIPKGSQRAS